MTLTASGVPEPRPGHPKPMAKKLESFRASARSTPQWATSSSFQNPFATEKTQSRGRQRVSRIASSGRPTSRLYFHLYSTAEADPAGRQLVPEWPC